MISLYQPPAMWGVANPSPFCLKLETFLRITELPFEIKPANFQKAPGGKIPYIKDEGEYIGDSTKIISYLQKKHNIDINSHLSESEKAISLAFQRLIEEHLYFSAIFSRWLETHNWEQTKAAFFSELPVLIKQVVPQLVRKKLKRDLKGHGIGRLSAEEIYGLGIDDIQALSSFLGKKTYFMGDQISLLDASAFGLLANIILVEMVSPLREEALKHPALLEYCQRIQNKYYSHI